MELLFLKNPYYDVDNEIVNFLKSKGYRINYSFGVERILIVLSQKVSDNHLNEFNDEFDYNLVLDEVSFDKFGEKFKPHSQKSGFI